MWLILSHIPIRALTVPQILAANPLSMLFDSNVTGFHSELQTANDASTSQKWDKTSDGSTSIKPDKPQGWQGTYTQDPSSLSCNDFKGSIVAGVTISCNDSASVLWLVYAETLKVVLD